VVLQTNKYVVITGKNLRGHPKKMEIESTDFEAFASPIFI
jgi:hypothetical protein